jgi:glutaminase
MALLESQRSADVHADTAVMCLELPIAGYEKYRKRKPEAGEHIMRNLAKLLSGRLMLANAKVDMLSSY